MSEEVVHALEVVDVDEAETSGDRCQRTTSTSAADAISPKMMIVQRRLAWISSRKGRRDVAATTSEMRTRLMPYCVDAEIATLAMRASVPSPLIRLTKNPPTPAAQPKRTIALAAKTNESETPPLFGPSIGTGYRLARVDAARSAATPNSMEAS